VYLATNFAFGKVNSCAWRKAETATMRSLLTRQRFKEPVMEGQWIRLNRLFSGSKRAVIVAVDHGEFFGPTPGIIDLPEAIQTLNEADGILVSPGMMAHCGHAFDHRNAPQAIVRLNWSTVYCYQWGYEQARSASVVSPAEALGLGADIALASLTLSGTDPIHDRDNVALFTQIVSQKRTAGIPLIGEFYPIAPEKMSPEALHKIVYTACRILAELGADAIKTFYTGERFADVVEACPVPIFTLGAEKTPREIDALNLAYRSVKAGARGVVFGRNVIQAANPANFLLGLKRVVKEGADPSDAAREFRLG
jgi:DhnA family fructose-bisphosphate aldolase class Ia